MALIWVLLAVWGFAEATLFFVIPDVALSFLALRSRRIALIACLWAFGGALAGGATMYLWGTLSRASAEAALEAVPAIDQDLIARVHSELEDRGVLAVVFGPLKATPYKIYAVEGGAMGVSPAGMIAASFASRLGRFLLVTFGVSWLARGALSRWSPRHQRWLLIGVWTIVYLVLMLR